MALAHALRRETDGNPFFLVEVIRHLADTGAFVQGDDGRWMLSVDPENLDLPTSLREVVAHRVARLGEDTEHALSLASVIGRDFDVDVLAVLLDGDEDRLLDLLEQAIGAGLISESDDEPGSYRFVHALIQHTLYLDMGATRRQRCHQRVAEALEARGSGGDDHVAELARHYMAATRPTDVAKALHYARDEPGTWPWPATRRSMPLGGMPKPWSWSPEMPQVEIGIAVHSWSPSGPHSPWLHSLISDGPSSMRRHWPRASMTQDSWWRRQSEPSKVTFASPKRTKNGSGF